MNMKNGIVYCLAEDYVDIEWEKAWNSDEKPEYYIVTMYNNGKCIKKYKPSVAKLLQERTGLRMEKL